MKFTSKTDLEANLNATFAAFSDFETFERQVLRSGASIARTDDVTVPGPGMMWDVAMEFRGKPRKIKVELVDFDDPNRLCFEAKTEGFDAVIEVDLTPLSGRQTRANVAFDIVAKTLAAKLALQTARLTKGTLNKRFNRRLHRFGREMEQRIKTA
jgi:carbon monoxide dehydrogenase subunit G